MFDHDVRCFWIVVYVFNGRITQPSLDTNAFEHRLLNDVDLVRTEEVILLVCTCVTVKYFYKRVSSSDVNFR